MRPQQTPTAIVADDERLMREQIVSRLKEAWPELEIGAEIVDGQLAVHVLDTGVGFMPKAEAGVGLANIRERLKALYNGRAVLIISVPPAGGTCATIKVPYEIAPASAPA